MAPWTPDMPWPSATPGGAWSPYWGGYLKLFVQAGIAPGQPFAMGPHPRDRLDVGNVLGGGVVEPPPEGQQPGDRLWVDLSCDVTDVVLQCGSSAPDGIFSRADASTVTVTLADPNGKYDPLNADSPFAYGGRSRLTPGVPVRMFVELVDGDAGTVSTHMLFTGTADRWSEEWVPRPSRRRAVLAATDVVKSFVKMTQPDVAPVGAGDTVQQRLQRIATHFAWSGVIVGPASSTVTLAATVHPRSAWEQVNDTLDNELGYVYFTPDGAMRWLNRSTWMSKPAPKLWLGCEDGAYDVLLDASPSAQDMQLKNDVHAANEGGTVHTSTSVSSVERYGWYSFSRTDLGLQTDGQVGTWAQDVVTLYAYPQLVLEDVTYRPAIVNGDSWKLWRDYFSVELVADLVRITWQPPDLDAGHRVDTQSRVVGYTHAISRHTWETKLELVDASAMQFAGVTFTMGPHSRDRLDAGFVLGM